MTTTNSITRHWILNLACEHRRRVSDVVPFVEELHLNVRKVPGVAPAEYAAGLLDLFDSGAIRLKLTDDDGSSLANRSNLETVLQARLELPPESRKTFRNKGRSSGTSPTTACKVPDLRWELSEHGGEEWESLAQPDWMHFAAILTDQKSGEMWSANFDLLMAELGWCRELNGVEIERTTLSLEVLHDFAITYWKVLPIVHHAIFQSRWVEHGWQVKGRPEPKWFRNWWSSRSDWYKKPWLLPGWPSA